MNSSVGLIHRFVQVFEEGASWERDHLDAMECGEVEELIVVGLRIHTTLSDVLSNIRDVSQKADPENTEFIYVREQALLNCAFCKSFGVLQPRVNRLRESGFEVRGAEQFLGCLRDAQRSFEQWESDQTKAMTLRAAWMRARGMAEAEIAEHCDPARYPADLQEEEDNVRAQAELKKLPSAESLWNRQVARSGPDK